jgi:hypothetical protein
MWEHVEGRPLGRLKPKCETNIKTGLKVTKYDDEHWIELAEVYVNLLSV